jgi:RimJ/RimL family protein N-acetyltransferase
MDETGAFAGRAGVRHVMVEETPELEIAYAFAQPFWGRGLASEIAEALTARALAALRPASLVGVVVIGNHASCRVLEKTGYSFERQVAFHDAPCRLYRIRPSA